jgi:hypothetical protein
MKESESEVLCTDSTALLTTNSDYFPITAFTNRSFKAKARPVLCEVRN